MNKKIHYQIVLKQLFVTLAIMKSTSKQTRGVVAAKDDWNTFSPNLFCSGKIHRIVTARTHIFLIYIKNENILLLTIKCIKDANRVG